MDGWMVDGWMDNFPLYSEKSTDEPRRATNMSNKLLGNMAIDPSKNLQIVMSASKSEGH